jgi:hypothetical protein
VLSRAASASSGLGPLELALLDAVDLLGADAGGDPVACSDVLDVVDRRDALGGRYAWQALVDLGVPWRVHLPLVELAGNCGTQLGDAPADPEFVEVRLSPFGALVLAAERGELGPVPVGLIEGSLYRGGKVPPFDPGAVVGALLAGEEHAGLPVMPTGGTVGGDVVGLLAGRPVQLTLGCTFVAEAGRLVITEIPLGVDGSRIVEAIGSATLTSSIDRHGDTRVVRSPGCPVDDVVDETTMRDGLRIVVQPAKGSDLRYTVEWLRALWPVTVGVDCRLPAAQPDRLAGWDRGDGSGLRALADLLRL